MSINKISEKIRTMCFAAIVIPIFLWIKDCSVSLRSVLVSSPDVLWFCPVDFLFIRTANTHFHSQYFVVFFLLRRYYRWNFVYTNDHGKLCFFLCYLFLSQSLPTVHIKWNKFDLTIFSTYLVCFIELGCAALLASVSSLFNRIPPDQCYMCKT